MALNLLAYLGCIVHLTYAVDDYGSFFGGVNHIAHGRWFSGFIFNVLLQKSFMPALSPIIAITFYILTGIGLCKLWGISRKSSFLIIVLWSLHPYLLGPYTFRISTVIGGTVYLIAIVALSLVSKGRGGFAFAVILFYLALSTYQVALGFAIAVIMVQVLLMSFRENFSAESIQKCIKLFFRYILMLGFSVIVYLVITKLLFLCLDVEANSRLQAGFISNIDQLKAKLCVIATVLFVRLGPIKEFVLPFTGKLVVFIIYILGILAVIRKSPRWHLTLGTLLWIILIPLGAISFALPLEALSLPWRVCMGLVVFLAGMFALTQESDSLLIRRTSMVLGGFLIIYFILNNNTILYKQFLTNQKDVFMGNRIIARIQSLENYQPGMELAIVGRTQKETFSKEGKSNLEIVRGYIQHCSVRRYSLAKSAFETDWSKYPFLLNYMNLELKRCGPESMKKARKFSADRNPWPDPSSLFIQEGIAVVVLSTPDIMPNPDRGSKKDAKSGL
ncbi:MAG: glucosyltransferase domain-containing protein [Planctomycetota bacterium]